MTAVHLALETYGEHDTADAAEAEMLKLIAQHPAYTRIANGISIGRYQEFIVASDGSREPVTRYKAYATIIKPDPSPTKDSVLGVVPDLINQQQENNQP